MLYNVGKLFGVVLCILTGFYIYHYHFGSMYGGKKYQKAALSAEAKVLLGQYYKSQIEEFNNNGKFNINLHKMEPYVNASNFTFGFANENKVIAKYCHDCEITVSAFKIAALGVYEEKSSVWVMDNFGNLRESN